MAEAPRFKDLDAKHSLPVLRNLVTALQQLPFQQPYAICYPHRRSRSMCTAAVVPVGNRAALLVHPTTKVLLYVVVTILRT